ncbi:D-2-hydroxyacid dehydrogenase [Chloroflexia bacterium SDU3-3]|nr:D-2-hydroxyacid dehydrogenase [Chloroflexia bacterium SDU3-3]
MKLIVPQTAVADIEPTIRTIAPDLSIVHIAEDGSADGDIADADAILRWMMSKVLDTTIDQAPRLRWVHTMSAGVDGFRLGDLARRKITLTNSAGAHAIAISEFVLSTMLGRVKRLRELASFTPGDAWQRRRSLDMGELYGQTVLILGLGSIGREIAKRAHAFGMRVIGSRRRPVPMPNIDVVVGDHQWRDLLPQADFVVVATPLTAATRGMVDADAFGRMKPGAYLINIARGQIVDSDALIDALRTRRLSGASLDTLPVEPLPADHPLWSAPNIWITPHISWMSPRTQERSLSYFYENLRRFVAGEDLINVVDIQQGY